MTKSLREILDGLLSGEGAKLHWVDDYDGAIGQALSDISDWLESKKMKEHGEFCSSHPEWHDIETMGSCDCSLPAHNSCIDELKKELSHDL